MIYETQEGFVFVKTVFLGFTSASDAGKKQKKQSVNERENSREPSSELLLENQVFVRIENNKVEN